MADSLALALDLGTTSIKAALLGANGELSHLNILPTPIIKVQDGRYESDAWAYFETTNRLLQKYLSPAKVVSLGLCCQRSSFVIWDKATGKPVTPLISWQDTRGAATCKSLKNEESLIQKLTGLRLTPYYFAPKVHLLLQEQPELHSGLERGRFLIGTLDSFMIWHWSGGTEHHIDVSMAARTLLMDIHTRQWSPLLCDLFNISQHILPEIHPSSGINLALMNGNIMLKASLADQSAAVIASIKPDSSEALINLGTGGFVIYCPAKLDCLQKTGYLNTLVYQKPESNPLVAAEGTLNSIAAALAPFPYKNCRIEDLGKIKDIFCISEPSGIGAPYFHDGTGVSFSAPITHLNPQQIADLLLEGIIFRITRIVDDFLRFDTIERVYLSGGLSSLSTIQQAIAHCSPVSVNVLLQKETSLLGAVILAADLPQAFDRQELNIEISNKRLALTEKYERWKTWFDGYLK